MAIVPLQMKMVHRIGKARELHPRHLPEIQEQARSLTPAAALEFVRGGREV